MILVRFPLSPGRISSAQLCDHISTVQRSGRQEGVPGVLPNLVRQPNGSATVQRALGTVAGAYGVPARQAERRLPGDPIAGGRTLAHTARRVTCRRINPDLA